MLRWVRKRGTLALAFCVAGCVSSEVAREREFRDLLVIERIERRGLPQETALLEQLFDSPSPAVRARAVRATRYRPGSRRLSHPVPLLQHEADPGVRSEVLYTLGSFSAPEVTQGLLSLLPLGSEDPRVRTAAAWLLGITPQVSTSLFESLLLDPHADVRRQAALALGRHPGPAWHSAPTWQGFFTRESDERVRWAGFWAAASRGGSPIVKEDVLVSAINDPNFFSAVFAMDALRQSQQAAGVEELLVLLRQEGRPWLVREAGWHTVGNFLGRETLAEHQRSAMERLLVEVVADASFQETHELVRQRVVYALARARAPEARLRLRRELERGRVGDATATLRSLAPETFFATTSRDPPRDAAALLDSLAERSEESVGGVGGAWARAAVQLRPRKEFARLIGKLDPERLASVLMASGPVPDDLYEIALREFSFEARQVALWRLLVRGDAGDLSRVVETLMPSAGGHDAADWPLRLLALHALDELPQEQHLECSGALREALADPVAAVARRAWTIARRMPTFSRDFDLLPTPPFHVLPYEGLALPVRSRLHHLRAEVTVRHRGKILIDLFPDRAPLHVAGFIALARGGDLVGSRIGAVNPAVGVFLNPGATPGHSLANLPIPPQSHDGEVLRGSVFSLPATWLFPESAAMLRRSVQAGVRGPSRAGSAVMAHVPIPELRGIATVWGRVVRGLEVADRLVAGDEIENVVVSSIGEPSPPGD